MRGRRNGGDFGSNWKVLDEYEDVTDQPVEGDISTGTMLLQYTYKVLTRGSQRVEQERGINK